MRCARRLPRRPLRAAWYKGSTAGTASGQPSGNQVGNWLLLRADLHTLFDLGLMRVDPDALRVVLADALRGTDYWQYHGAALRPRRDGSQPDVDRLRHRRTTTAGCAGPAS
ncbi:MAG TPA: HNH endonuclease [Humisphaera sp.]